MGIDIKRLGLPRSEKRIIEELIIDLKPMWEDGFYDYVHGAITALVIMGYQRESEEIIERINEYK